MSTLTEAQELGWRTIKIINIGILFFCPVIYLVVVWLIFSSLNFEVFSKPNQMIQYIFFGLAIVLPMLIPMIVKIFTAIEVKNDLREPQIKNAGKFQTISIIKAAIIESIYVFGLAIFFMNHTIDHLWYFYAIGIFWTYIHFPRKSQYIEFINKEQTNVVTN